MTLPAPTTWSKFEIIEDAILYDLATLTTLPTQAQRAALEAMPAEGIVPARLCAELDIEAGSTWGQVRADILGDIDPEMRCFSITVTRTAPFRLPARSADEARELMIQWLEDGEDFRTQPPGLEEVDSWWDELDVTEADG